MPQTFRLHTIDDAHDTSTNYVAITGKQTLWQGAEPRQPDFLTDEPGNTLLIAEFVGHPIPWSKPEDLQFDSMDLTVDSSKGICSVFSPPAFVAADGNVTMLPRSLTAEDVRSLLTAQGGEPGCQLEQVTDGRSRQLRTQR